MSSTTNRSKKLKTYLGDDNSSGINLSDHANISLLNDDCLRTIFSYLPIRDRIKIQRVCKTWQKVSKSSCHNIRHIEISNKLFGKNEKIKSGKVPFSMLNHAFSLCGSGLKSISLSSLAVSDMDCLNLLKTSCPNLQSIDLSECNIEIAKFLIANFTNLSSISLTSCRKNSETLLSEYFSKNKNLTSLSIEHNDHLVGSCLLSLPESVKSLSIRLCKNISPENIGIALQKLTQLKSLTLSGDLKFIEKINTILQHIPTNSTIEELDITFFTVRRTKKIIDVLNFQSLTNLKVLRLQGNILFYDETMPCIVRHCQKLTHLSLTGCEYITDWGLEPFMKLLNIESLFISDSIIQDVDYMLSLKYLTCHCCHSLDENSIGSLIKASKNLKRLDVLLCEDIDGKLLVNTAVEAHTRDEFLELNYMDRSCIIEVKITASRLYIIKDTSKCLSD